MKDKKTINAEAAKAASDDIHASSIPNEIKLMVQLANSCQVVVEDVFMRIKGVYAKHGFRSTIESEKPMNPVERIGSYNIVPYIDDKIAALQDMWRKEKVSFDWDDLKDMIEDVARHFAKWGAERQKEQMMKEAVEGDIGMTLHDKRADLYVRSKGYLPESLGIKCNDKVRIIIVKEDEK